MDRPVDDICFLSITRRYALNSTGVILSGMRPTGALHLGHYVGVIKNMVSLQKLGRPCFYFLADWHALNALFDHTEVIQDSRLEYVRGWVAAGLDPQQSPIYRQSDIPEVLMLNQFFQCLTPPGWADRSPSWKDFTQNPNADRKLDNVGFFAYPILQAADIAIVEGQSVPVGADQVAHIELAREIIRKFNRQYKANLPEPEAKLTSFPKLPGVDGHMKMSSSLGNVISLSESEKSLQKKVNKIKTDDQRGGMEKPGNPDNCTVFEFHKAFCSSADVAGINQACRRAEISCGECKARLGEKMKEELIPISDRYQKLTPQDCQDILQDGAQRARTVAQKTWSKVLAWSKF
jgi:tryptophanyl-tRNA synthetase